MNKKLHHSQHKFIFAIPGLFVLFILSGFTLITLLNSQGWPQNHEYDGFFQRTLSYAQHFQQGDWFPIWSTADNYDLGSPQPALYHKLFYLSAGFFLYFSGAIKESILLSLWFWFFIGGLGMYWFCRELRCSAFFSWCGACMLVVANYTVTDWLIRGAMAEISAMMLIPALLASYIRWLDVQGRTIINYALIGFFLGLIFLGHSVIAYYLVLLLSACTLVLLCFQRIDIKKLNAQYLLILVAVFCVVAGPYILAMQVLGVGYDLRRLLVAPFLPEYSIKPFSNYFWDSDWIWGKKWDSYTVQLDTPVWILLISGIGYKIFTGNFSDLRSVLVDKATNSFFVLLICAAILFFLQTKFAIIFYRTFPGAAYLQFPWRLLGILTPVMIALSLSVWSVASIKLGQFLIFLCLISMVFLCGAWAHRDYEQLPEKEINLSNLTFGWNRVYLPTQLIQMERLLSSSPGNASLDDGIFLTLVNNQIYGAIEKNKCILTGRENQRQVETLTKNFEISCEKTGMIPLPLVGTPLHRIQIRRSKEALSPDFSNARCMEVDSLPGICGVLISHPGVYDIVVSAPTFGNWVSDIVR